MPVYKFSHQLLAVLVHLAHTAVKWKTNFLTLDVGDKLVNTDDTALPCLHGRVPLWHARLCGSSVSGFQVIPAGGTRFC